jgi:hypothetical protein
MTTTVISDENLWAIIEAWIKAKTRHFTTGDFERGVTWAESAPYLDLAANHAAEMAQELLAYRAGGWEWVKAKYQHADMVAKEILRGQEATNIIADADLPDVAVEMERRYQAARRDEIVRERP